MSRAEFIEITTIAEAVAGWVTHRIIDCCVGSFPSVFARFAESVSEGFISPLLKETLSGKFTNWPNIAHMWPKNAATLSRI